MSIRRVACIQTRTGVDIATNLEAISVQIREAASDGARLIATPEMTNILDIRPGQARPKLVRQDEDEAIQSMSRLASALGVHLLIGSIAVLHETDERAANRSCLIGPDGQLIATYDKIHMFDVDIDDGQDYRESKAYRPGDAAVLVSLPEAKLGLTICYDVRFPHLFRQLAQAGADIITVPSAFTKVTGDAHWHSLIRARAIETGCFIVAPAQGGSHEDGRETFGHSLIVNPWGEIIAEADHDDPTIIAADLDLDEVAAARSRIPALRNDVATNIPLRELG